MSNKCEWDKGEFYPCSEGAAAIPNGEIQWKVPIAGSEERWVIREFHYCPFCGADIRKPVEIKVGMFGKFWDTSEKDGHYSVLTAITKGGFCHGSLIPWAHFTPGLPEGFNQDGTPKENEDE